MYNDGINNWINKNFGDNGVFVVADGSLRAKGTAVVYDDIIGNLFSQKLYSNQGKVDFDWDNNLLKFQSGGSISNTADRVQMNLQLLHKAVIGADSFFKLHFHHFQEDALQRTLTLEYRIQNNGEATEGSWSTLTTTTNAGNDVFVYPGSGIFNQITTFPEIDVTGCNISSTLQFRIARTDSNSGDLLIYFLDAHIAIDSDGSQTEWSKD